MDAPITYILVFLALAVGGSMVLVTVQNVLSERAKRAANTPQMLELEKLITPARLAQRRLICLCAMLLLPVLALVAAGIFHPAIVVPAAIAGAAIGYQAPFLVYRRKLAKRRFSIEDKLLEFTITLVNGLKSGMAFGQSLEATTRHASGPIKEEFQQLIREQRLGLPLEEALDRLYNRVPCEDMKLLVTTVKLTTRTGGSLVEVLAQMVDTMRKRKEFADKLRTMTAQGRFEAIAVSCSPVAGFLLIGAINPELMKPLVTTGLGWAAIGVIAVLIGLGYLVIHKIVSIEV